MPGSLQGNLAPGSDPLAGESNDRVLDLFILTISNAFFEWECRHPAHGSADYTIPFIPTHPPLNPYEINFGQDLD